MSYDVSIMGPSRLVECVCVTCRDQHTRVDSDELFTVNHTSNTAGMWI